MKKRIIPCLDIKDGKVVKGVNFEGLKVMGDPVSLAKKYADEGAEELIILDISATNEQRDTSAKVVEEVCQSVEIPVTVGGGIKSLADIARVLNQGAKRVSIGTAALKDPEMLRAAVEKFGGKSIVVAIDVKQIDGQWQVMTHGGKQSSGVELMSYCRQLAELKVGEILLTSMASDGMKNGYDIELLKMVKTAIGLPLIASGGCGEMSHIAELFIEEAADAALVASLLHYGDTTVDEIQDFLATQGVLP
ncbi:imidazole glycerol phosphate synthase subunit HisF [Vagococcus elongatus]|uniref:Imidazole glycerol phosphate synthase subunit HisF n=1 Tax=Vagococcus elongatus TaxID=180344 RepID=A0A430ALV9_9ENTE|nr:imidazole glycerol phosphate synthase subunit HisF [Vagococcus elongatus]RSU09075.1 imidazole glycerol phosphate synthase subunit HisF [Vagococcus elongatus]